MLFFRTLHRACIGCLSAALVFLPVCADAARGKPPVTAAQPATPATALFSDTFRKVIEQGVANGAYRTVAVGVIDGKQTQKLYFGHRDGATTPAADDDSQFEIGALSEVFTGLLLAEAALEGKLRLRDPLRKYLPADFPFAEARVGDISLDALVTQHSGLPPQPTSLFPADVDDPYIDYAGEDLLAFLAFYRSLPAQEDIGYGYSVLNAGILGHLLGRIYTAPYTEVLTRKILAPLGLKHTSPRDDATLLPGHARGESAAHWHYGVLAGAASLRSSLPDLLQFLQHNLTPGDSPLRAALLLARQGRASGPADRIGLGWNVREAAAGETTWPLVWRASETAGFSTFVGFRTDRQRAIVLLGNAAEDLAGLGIAWLNDELPPPAPHGYVATASKDVAAYSGLYEISPGSDLIVRAHDGALSLQLPGLLPQRLHAVDKDVFVARVGVLGATFMRNVDEITGLVLHLNGNHASARRLSERAPQVAHTPIELHGGKRDEFLGDYSLDANTWMRVAKHADTLSVQLTMSERRVIFAYAPDRFADADGAVDLLFRRDGNGRIVGATLDLAGTQRSAIPLRRMPPGRPAP
jgi:CubicO group peptidase (beta-lactamase class C family)